MEALVNNAGIYGGQGSLDHKIFDVNLIGMVHGTKLAREKMSVENGGLDIWIYKIVKLRVISQLLLAFVFFEV